MFQFAAVEVAEHGSRGWLGAEFWTLAGREETGRVAPALSHPLCPGASPEWARCGGNWIRLDRAVADIAGRLEGETARTGNGPRAHHGVAERAAAAPRLLAEVLRATAGMPADRELTGLVRARIESGRAPAAAVDDAVAQLIAMLNAAGGLIAGRSTDLRSVRGHVVARILGLPAPGRPELRERSVVCAVDLSPADTAALDLGKVAALVTESGGPTGHMAIIAQQLGIPCVVRATGIPEETLVAVDAANGTITANPDQALIEPIQR